ncbi:NUDIX domain-containing protein [Halopelagius longus]|uniref:NUDIX domain-containing protein n=1 Tax=Halopelagius longus TaxID=1236180 RepID=A0A1H0XXR3_9EURY|nr:NUDIX domain-containing protein [Halopelagius longus]RDI72155.1 NUDIX domain-containing protein [Halopelagius longus]SDQ07601.1 Translation initiation factor 2B subunit, eIF-2B alpha/beta/delta family [Halopelagius longus]
MTHVVTCFVRNRGRVLLVRRSDSVGTFPGRWAGVSGYVEGDPAAAEDDARRELREEVRLGDGDVELVRVGAPLDVTGADGEFTVHPFLFEAETRETVTNEEISEAEWTDPTAIFERETVPELWETWRRVAPSLPTVREDRTHGSAWIAARALETLRDDAAESDDWESVARTARKLRDARPNMAAVSNRVNRAMATADRTPDSVRERCIALLRESLDATDAAAETAAERLAAREATTLATLSRSGTVRATVVESDPEAVVVAESRPDCEGVGVAEWVAAETDADAALTTEAAIPAALSEFDADAAVVGADAVLSDGRVVNKTGTTALALAAREADIPIYAVAARDKVRPAGDSWEAEETTRTDAVYDGEEAVSVFAPTFEATPAGLVDAVVTEAGLEDAEDVRRIAEEHAENAAWDESGP